ncbi:MAG: hypothetical protein K940chlam6_00952 [Chlamydiae bacterium]|nr:hypothetical protein [Chlamydiota bacterium]
MTSVTSPTTSDINNFFAVREEMESSDVDKIAFANRITEIEFENPVPENYDEVKRELYEMTAQKDKDMGERAFVVACYVKLHLFLQLEPILGISRESIRREVESLKTPDSKQYFEKSMNSLILQPIEYYKLLLMNDFFVSGESTNDILEHFNLIKGDSYKKLVKFNHSIGERSRLAKEMSRRSNSIYLKANDMDKKDSSSNNRLKWAAVAAAVAVAVFAVYTQSYST